jgi:hypothetical protein
LSPVHEGFVSRPRRLFNKLLNEACLLRESKQGIRVPPLFACSCLEQIPTFHILILNPMQSTKIAVVCMSFAFQRIFVISNYYYYMQSSSSWYIVLSTVFLILYRTGFCVLELSDVPAGSYHIIPSTFRPECEGPFILEVSSSSRLTLRKM